MSITHHSKQLAEKFSETTKPRISSMNAWLRAHRGTTLATITHITPQIIVCQYQAFGPKEAFDQNVDIHMCEGGSLESVVTQHLAATLPEGRVLSLDESGMSSSAKEAVFFAIQKLNAAHGRPLAVTITSDTLTPNFVTAKVTPDKEWRRLMTKARNFGNEQDLPSVEDMVLKEKYLNVRVIILY